MTRSRSPPADRGWCVNATCAGKLGCCHGHGDTPRRDSCSGTVSAPRMVLPDISDRFISRRLPRAVSCRRYAHRCGVLRAARLADEAHDSVSTKSPRITYLQTRGYWVHTPSMARSDVLCSSCRVRLVLFSRACQKARCWRLEPCHDLRTIESVSTSLFPSDCSLHTLGGSWTLWNGARLDRGLLDAATCRNRAGSIWWCTVLSGH